jgi:hypothetical protein
MNSNVAMISVSVVLMTGFIFSAPLSNIGKVFAQSVTTASNQSIISKANTATTSGAKTTTSIYLNFSRAAGTVASLQNESGKPTWVLSGI